MKSEPFYKKGLIMVIDGVRADAIHKTMKATRYHNNFRSLEQIAPEDLYKAVSIADLPTGTAMRILSTFSGVTTTLLSAQKSFSQQACSADNLVQQLVAQKKRSAFFGDETWTYLFPEIKEFVKETYHPYGLVEFSTEERLMKAAEEALVDHEVVILHLISPDSYGHLYGTDSLEVQKALVLIDQFIERVYRNLDDETLVAVLSDHGVNDDGSHGGTSFLEKAASLVLIGKDIRRYGIDVSHSSRVIVQKNEEEVKQLHLAEPAAIVSQNDILPTICALLGLPTPYNSPGTLIPEVLSPERYTELYEMEIERKRLALHYLGCSAVVTTTRHTREAMPVPAHGGALVYENDALGRQIHALFHGSSVLGMVAALGVLLAGTWLLASMFLVQWWHYAVLFSMAGIVLVGHSVFAVIHEDVISLVWCELLGTLCLGFDWASVGLVLGLVVGKFPLHDVDRFWWIKWVKKVPEREKIAWLGAIMYICAGVSLGVLVVLRGLRLAGNERASKHQASRLVTGPLMDVFLALGKFFSDGVLCRGAWVFSLIRPASIVALLYSPGSAIFFRLVFTEYLARLVTVRGSSVAKGCAAFFLLKLMFFCTGHNHSLSTINWEAAFLFTTKACPGVSSSLVVGDLLLPYVYVSIRLGRKDLAAFRVLLLLQAACFITCSAINLWFLGQSLLWFIFAGRTIFEGVFFLFLAASHVLLSILDAGKELKSIPAHKRH
ncbi:GPI ethanolamine phosphate transferase 3 subunit O [Nematocida homosporus]|uniref:GPI ethanolamine phosphate transferase 3 subunit O n=1 Tax=Nematocida homosporus TaxID=1912981 RepID=UPI00221EAD3C|nr:GPI ethanolamine phosphate transferase 3 subunit O [Nematocida homosporus]KAI5185421.1 GPI ethanolamine phosphate transferase 3 subunit O [Nematocida homosporus]